MTEFSKFDNEIARQIKTPEGREKKPSELHSVVLNILRYSYPSRGEGDEAQAQRFQQMHGSLAQFRDVIPEKTFQEYCVAFATGMQFALDQHGPDAKPDLLEFTIADALPGDKITLCITSRYTDRAIAKQGEHSKIALSRNKILEWARYEQQGATFGTGHSPREDLSLVESALAFGVEEMDHAIRHQALWRKNHREATSEELQILEDSAKPLVHKAVEVFRLGKSRRGPAV